MDKVIEELVSAVVGDAGIPEHVRLFLDAVVRQCGDRLFRTCMCH